MLPITSILSILVYFSLRIWTNATTICGKTYRESLNPVLVNIPESYRSGVECSFTIQLPSQDQRIALKWMRFSLGGKMPHCVLDYAALFTCNQSHQIIRYCGEGVPPDFYSDSNCLKIKFLSHYELRNNTSASLKFLLQYQVLDTTKALYRIHDSPNCFNMRRRKSLTTRSIYSPNWPLSYTPYLNDGAYCNTSINVPKDYGMKVLFIGFSLNKSEDQCNNNDIHDVLTISTHKEGVALKKQLFCGNLGTFYQVINDSIDRVDFTLRTARFSRLVSEHQGFVLGISLFNTSLEIIDLFHINTTILGNIDSNASPALSVIIIVAVVILLCCAGCFLGITRDYCKDCFKRRTEIDKSDRKEMMEEDRERHRSQQSVQSNNIMYSSSV